MVLTHQNYRDVMQVTGFKSWGGSDPIIFPFQETHLTGKDTTDSHGMLNDLSSK